MTDSLDLTLALQLLQTGPVGILLLNGQGRVRWSNDTLLSWLGVSAEELVGRDQQTINHPELRELFQPRDRLHIQPRHAPERWLSCRQLTLDARASNQLAAWYFLDDTPQEQLSAQLREQSLTDQLTGLPNRRALMLALEPQVSRCRRYNSALSVVLLALQDDGRPADDEGRVGLRLAVSHLLKDQLRWADLIGHSEDDEFILVLPETGEDDARRLVEKLSGRLTQLGSGDPAGGAHFGVSTWRKSDDATTLLRRASVALAESRGAA